MNIDDDDFVFPVYVTKKVIEFIVKLCKSTNLEIFGYLIGNIFKWKGQTYVIIRDPLYIKGAIHSHKYSTAQIEGTAGQYDEKFQKLKHKRKDKDIRVLGWWHSHPNFGCFLSTIDIATQEFFFPESYQVALVVDPIKDSFNFFALDNNNIKKYRELSFAIISG